MRGTQTLLAEYANGGSEHAFRELVAAYVDFVYSIALRIVGGDRPLAEDVTQAVFTDLARKAGGLPKEVRLGGWLHRHTSFVARNTLRRERRRIAREKRAVELHSIEDYTEANLAQLGLVLDEVINDLPSADREAIMLRFFEELDFRSIGEVLGSSEDAARMRVSRAVDKVGALLKRKGFVLTAAGISYLLSGKMASAAPTGLATRIIYVEYARVIKAPGLFGVVKEACFTRLNVGIVSAAVILALLVLIFSGGHRRAKVSPDPNGKSFTPAEFVGLSSDGAEEQPAAETEVVSVRSEPPPATEIAPARVAAVRAAARTNTVKPVVANQPRALPRPVPVEPAATPPTPTASVPMDSPGGTAQGAAQNANAWGQGTRRAVPPAFTQPVRPQAPAAKAPTNDASGGLANGVPPLFNLSQPWSATRTMATIEAPANSPSALGNQPTIQGARPPPRLLPLSNDPRRREHQP